MSLITSCPVCTTSFRVVPDQLRISEGWVRCGHCSEIFDANQRLHADSEPAPAPARTVPSDGAAPAPAPAFAPMPVTSPVPKAAPVPVPGSLLKAAVPPSPFTAGAQSANAGLGPQPTMAAVAAHPMAYPPFVLRRQDEAPQSLEDSAADTASSAGAVDKPAQRQAGRRTPPSGLESASRWPESDPLAGAVPQRSVAPEPDDDDAPSPTEDVPFVRQARRRAFWRRGSVRFVLSLLALSLAGLLAAQAAVQHRDWLAAVRPDLRPHLETLCQPLACNVGPWRHIDAVVIDSSSFTRAAGDAYRLQVSLRNQAAVDVALPALELTLIDAQEQTVLRRVLRAAELGPRTPATLPAGSEWSGSLTLSVAPGAGGNRVAGYRVLAFYP